MLGFKEILKKIKSKKKLSPSGGHFDVIKSNQVISILMSNFTLTIGEI